MFLFFSQQCTIGYHPPSFGTNLFQTSQETGWKGRQASQESYSTLFFAAPPFHTPEWKAPDKIRPQSQIGDDNGDQNWFDQVWKLPPRKAIIKHANELLFRTPCLQSVWSILILNPYYNRITTTIFGRNKKHTANYWQLQTGFPYTNELCRRIWYKEYLSQHFDIDRCCLIDVFWFTIFHCI